MILTNDAELAQRLDAIAYPGLTANFDLSKTAALIIATLDMREYGSAYAKMCIANAQALAQALATRNLPVFHVPNKGFTSSQHIAIAAERFGGGTAACRLLEKANILASGIGLPLPALTGDFNGIRLGTQEITRWGLQPEHMDEVADLISRVIVAQEEPDIVKAAVINLRKQFTDLHYIRR
jgi:glycine hydroxymethyltransferase